MFGPLHLDQKLVVLCPLNDAQGSRGGGSHWAMLVLVRNSLTDTTPIGYLLDSSSGSPMTQVANAYLDKLLTLMKVQNSANKTVKVVNAFPKQDNMYDCGIFALCGAEAVLKLIKAGIEGA